MNLKNSFCLKFTMFSKKLFDLFLCAGVRKVPDEESTGLCNIFLLFILLERPGKASVNVLVLSLSLPLTPIGVHTEDLNVTPT